MKAAVVTDFRAPLRLEDRDVPRPGPGQIPVRMQASGLCHKRKESDLSKWCQREDFSAESAVSAEDEGLHGVSPSFLQPTTTTNDRRFATGGAFCVGCRLQLT
jgi:hypothetical protein